MPPKMQKVHIETWGCQMNVADSEQMFAMLKERHYEHTDSAEDADLVILNTCHIREKAYHKVVSRLGILERMKQQKAGMKIAVSGCVAQAEGQKLLDRVPAIDLLLGPGQIRKLPELLDRQALEGGQHKAIGFKRDAEPEKEVEILSKPYTQERNAVARYVNIQQGCNNFCTFCVVPFTRGREISEMPESIIHKCRSLLAAGSKEITLLGQNVNSYGLDLVAQEKLQASADGPFVDLLRQVSALPGLASLRFTTSNPHDLTRPLSGLFAELPNLGHYYHLPIQSGSDRILSVMRRKVTVAEYHERVEWLRQAAPDIALSTDIIVGFPSETDEEFEMTVEAVKKIRYSFIFSFAYSQRKGTAAQRFQEQVPDDVKSRRLSHLNQVQDRITLELNAEEVGQHRKVLVHYESKKEPGIYYGRTSQFKLVRIAARRDLIGQEVDVRIVDSNKTALVGEL